ncbi:glycosyltransferase family 2 protein [Sphingomonas sp. PAMC 26605]|uniref:glycosyltransferase family 2 protein n=1 Tax=Sphingomonas sp. PAMC 26605 TaxID=1112214 RepID=UPI00026CA720|nr:glycosyltransferase [Sphingomonas sp. PAMC 26605]
MTPAAVSPATVSVIITCYNLERYIEGAIRSVLDQTCAAAEIIVVDDASIDGSRERIATFGDRIRLVALARNEGVLGATLAGLQVASGEIIAFLDGDDLWRPHKLERVAAAFAADPHLILLSHDYAIIDADGVATGAIDATKRNTRRLLQGHPSPELLSERLKDSITGYRGVWLGSAYSIRRAAIDLPDLERFIASVAIPQFRRLSYQDHLLAQYAIVSRPDGVVGFIDEALFDYRIFAGNTSGLSATRAAALRTLTRAHVNVLGTQALLRAFPRFDRPLRRQRRLASEYRYMTALYTGRWAAALGLACRLAFGFWAPRRTSKEIARIAAVLALGADRFLDIKRSR